MTKLKISKKIISETLCQIKGGKICRVSSKTKRPSGVYTTGRKTWMLGLDGKKHEVVVPAGVIYYGHATVKISPNTPLVGQ